MFNFLAESLNIGEKVSEIIIKYVDLVVDTFKTLVWWLQAVIILFLLIFLVLGILRFIVKSWKLILVLVILAAIGVVVFIVFNKTTTTTEPATTLAAIKYSSSFLKACL